MISDVQLRWQDFDGLGHVHHAAVLNLLERGRDAELGACGLGSADYVVGRCAITYLREIRPEAAMVAVECTISEIGRSSFQTRETIFGPSGEVATEATLGLVMWNRETASSRPITETERAAMTERMSP